MQRVPAIFLLACVSVVGRSSDGLVTGTVIDWAGQILPGTVVTMKSIRPNSLLSKTRSDAHGHFRFTKVKPETYEVCVKAPRGFKSRCLTPFTVSVGTKKDLNQVPLDVEQCCGGISIP